MDYTADRAEFDADRSTLHLSGSVVLRQSTMTVKGEDLWIDTTRRSGRSEGPLLVEDGLSAVYGSSGTFDLARETGRLFNTSAGAASWSIHAREAELGGGRRLTYRDADFTSCDRTPPHYHFHAARVSVVPKSRIIATNALFYLGDVPVFYTPFLYETLKPVHWLGWKTQPGFDRRNGGMLKNTLLTQYSTSTYSKLFADYYTRQGVGYGGELERHEGVDSRGALYGYRIHETSTGSDRWGFLGQGYQALPSSSAFQGRFQFQSDPNFNNDYNRSSLFRVTPDLTNNAAFVHRFSNGTARLSYARFDVANGVGFKKSTEDAPRLDYQSLPLRVSGLPWLNTFSGYADNSFDASRPFLQKSVNGAWEGTRSFVLARGVAFAPKLGYSETYYNRFDELGESQSTNTFRDGAIGRWIAVGDLRYNSRLGHWDVTQAYSRRLAPDGFSDDAGAADKGVERNLLSVSDLVLPLPRVWGSVSSGYDFRTFRDRQLGFRDRLQPIVAQGHWTATERLDFSLRDDYQLQRGNRAIVADARWGKEEGASAGGGFSYNISSPDRYYANAEFAIAPSSPTWRVLVSLRGLVQSEGGIDRVHGLRVFEKEIAWTRRWHDFYTKLGARLRPGGVGEVTARVDFKFGVTDPKQAPHRDWELEWFPERATQDVLRP